MSDIYFENEFRIAIWNILEVIKFENQPLESNE